MAAMAETPGPDTADDVTAMLETVDAETSAAADPDWQARYGANLASYTHHLFGA